MRLHYRLCRNMAQLIDKYSNYNPSPMSLKKLTDFGKPIYKNKTQKIVNEDLINKTEIKSFEFLREEMLVRLAAMMKEMLYLPENLVKTSSVQEVYGWYMQSFVDLVDYKDVKKVDDKVLKKSVLLLILSI
jgi:pyruvate dehydrogenase kinase 2/3/4